MNRFSPTDPANYSFWPRWKPAGGRDFGRRKPAPSWSRPRRTPHHAPGRAAGNDKRVYRLAGRQSGAAQRAGSVRHRPAPARLDPQAVRTEAAPEADTLRAEIALTQEEQNLLTAVGSVKQARANLNAQLGRSPDLPVDAAEPLTFKPVTVDLGGSSGPRERPEIHSSEANSAGSGRDGEDAALAVLSRPGAGYRSAVSARRWGVSAPLFDFGGIRGAVRKAREDVQAQQAQTEQTRQQVRLQVQNAYDALEQARKTVLLYENKETGILRAPIASCSDPTRYGLGASTIST